VVPQLLPFDTRAKENVVGDNLLKHQIDYVITAFCIIINIVFVIS